MQTCLGMTFEKIMQRVVMVIEANSGIEPSDKQIAYALDMSPSNYVNKKKKETIPYESLVKFCQRNEVTLHWVITGDCNLAQCMNEELSFRKMNSTKKHQEMLESDNLLFIEELDRFIRIDYEAKQILSTKGDYYDFTLTALEPRLIDMIEKKFNIICEEYGVKTVVDVIRIHNL